MRLIIDAAGSIACLYDEAIDLAAFGKLTITRASHVEPNEFGRWLADLAPVGGPVLGPFNRGVRRWRPSECGLKSRPLGDVTDAAKSLLLALNIRVHQSTKLGIS